MSDRYRKRQVEVTATQYNWNPNEIDRLNNWANEVGVVLVLEPDGLWSPPEYSTVRIWIEKSQTWGELENGDWIIVEPDGIGVYPCKKDIFADSYEKLPALDPRLLGQ